MKKTALYVIVLTMYLLTTNETFAAVRNSQREDSSSFVVWAFLGFCALIVVSQLFPLVRNLWSSRKVVGQAEKQKVKS